MRDQGLRTGSTITTSGGRRAHFAPEGPAASQSRQARAAINRVLNIKRGDAPDGAVYIGRATPRYGLSASRPARTARSTPMAAT